MIKISDMVDASQLDPANTDNPDGQFQNYVAGSKPGTPLLSEWMQTTYYFYRKLIAEGQGVEPNNIPDDFTTNQPFDALNTFISNKVNSDTVPLEESVLKQNIAFNLSRYNFENLKETGLPLSFTPIDNISLRGKVNNLDDGTTDDIVVGIDYPFAGTWNAVACNTDESIVVSVKNGAIAYSINKGVSWAQNTILGDWKDVSYSAALGVFIAVKENAFSVSSNGVSWVETIKAGAWNKVACSQLSELIVFADNSSGFESTKDLITFGSGTVDGVISSLECYGDDFFICSSEVAQYMKVFRGNSFRGGLVVFNLIKEFYSSSADKPRLAGSSLTGALVVNGDAGPGFTSYLTFDFNGVSLRKTSSSAGNGSLPETAFINSNGEYVGYTSFGERLVL